MDKRKVLIVDDSIGSAKQLQKIIEDSGAFEIVGHGKNGIEGIRLFSLLKPDIVCMDIIMPDMDGLQAIRNIIRINKDAKIIVISSAGSVGENMSDAIKFGAKNVLTKPYEANTIIDILKKI